MKNFKLILKEALFSVIVLKVVILFLMGALHFFESLNPLELSIQEIDFLDLHYRQDNREGSPESVDVVLINSGSIPDTSREVFRDNFALILNAINSKTPSVLGIDIEFEEKSNPLTDLNLVEALDSFPNLVMAEFGNQNAITSKNASKANISLIGSIIETKRFYALNSEDTVSFALAVSQKYLNKTLSVSSDPLLIDHKYNFKKSLSWEKLDKANDSNGVSIPIIEAGEILKKIEDTLYLKRLNLFLKDKIVLVGHLGRDSAANPFDLEDKHIVPDESQDLLGKIPNTPGLFIHAQVIEMLINDRVVKEFKGFLKGFLEWFILIAVAILYVYLAHNSIWFKPIVLPLSFIFIFILVYIALLLRDQNIYWPVGQLTLQIVILIESVEFYEPISVWLNKKWRIKSYFVHEKNH